jgi:ClpP class serine protease
VDLTDLEVILGVALTVAAIAGIYFSSSKAKTVITLPEKDANKAERDKMRMEVLAERARIIEAIERERGTKVITLIHRREPWLKEGEAAYITIEDTEHILRQIKGTPKNKPIDVILHTPGGLALAAEMIATALHEHPANVAVFIPFYAMSGGTLLALAADEIYMENFSVMGPVDPQIEGVPASAYMLVLEKKRMDAIADKTIALAYIAAMAVKNMKGFVKHLLAEKMDDEKSEKVAEFLTGGYITHDTPLTIELAKSMNLPVREGVPQKVFDLFLTCEFGVCDRPSLSYVPNTKAS